MNYKKAFKAGVVGALVMTVLMAIARACDATPLNLEMILGSLFTGSISALSWMIGFIVHLVVGGVVAQLYALGFEYVAQRANMWIGAGLALGHAAIAGMAMFVLGSLHPLMRIDGGLPAPGPFAINFGTLTAVVFVGLHLVYGSWVGSLYSMRPASEEARVAKRMPHAA